MTHDRAATERVEWLLERLIITTRRVHQFDGKCVRPRLNLESEDLREQAMNTALLRSLGNVRSLIQLADSKSTATYHFQAIGMIARSLLELAIDARLIELRADAGELVKAYADCDRLRAANKIVSHNEGKKHSHHAAAQQRFKDTKGPKIMAKAKDLWPDKNAQKKWRLPNHWSGASLVEAAKEAGEPLADLYATEYTQLSWTVHSGLAGVLGLNAEVFPAMCASFIQTALSSYTECLAAGVRHLNLGRFDPAITRKLATAADLSLD